MKMGAAGRGAGAALAAWFLIAAVAAGGCGRRPGPLAAYAGVSVVEPTGTPAISRRGLVAAFDTETLTADGFLRDFSGNGLHGSLEGPAGLDGLFGRARGFGAVERRVSLPAAPEFDLDGPLSLAAWPRVDGLGLHQHVAACDDKWALWITPANQFRLGDTRGGGFSTPEGTVVTGRWTSVVVRLNGTRGDRLEGGVGDIFVDGRLAQAEAHLRTAAAEVAAAWSPGELYPSDACYLGFESHQGEPRHQEMPFAGSIDEVLVFSRALSSAKIEAFSRR